MTLPSARHRANDKARVHSRTVVVWRCRDCGETYDAQPVRMQFGIRRIGMCPNLQCGDSSIKRMRVKD